VKTLQSLVLALQYTQNVPEREEEVEELQGWVYVVHVASSSRSLLVLWYSPSCSSLNSAARNKHIIMWYGLVHTTETKKLSTSKFVQQAWANLVLSADDLAGGDNSSPKTARLSQKHFLDRVPLSEGKMKAQKWWTICFDKEKHLEGKTGRKDTTYQCTDCNVGPCPFLKNILHSDALQQMSHMYCIYLLFWLLLL
jgi:hypothetical protein